MTFDLFRPDNTDNTCSSRNSGTWDTRHSLSLGKHGGYSLNLSWHFLFHMKPPVRPEEGEGRAMLENGLELMLMRGSSFFREDRWPSFTMPNTSSRERAGNMEPRSLRREEVCFKGHSRLEANMETSIERK